VVEEEPLGDVAKPRETTGVSPVVEEEPLGDVAKPGETTGDVWVVA
jgi:hypothetical protein